MNLNPIDILKKIFGGPTYTNPEGMYWTLDQLKTAVSPRVGLEAQLDLFVVEGKLKIGDADVPYRVEHYKAEGRWRMYVSADTPQACTEVERIVRSVFAGGKVQEKGKEYIAPRENPSTSEVVDTAAFQYSRFLTGSYVARVNFKGKSAKEKANKAGLVLEELKPK